MAPHGIILTPIVTKRSPNNSPRVPMRCQKSHPNTIFQPTHCGPKTANASPVGPHRVVDLGTLEIAPRTPSLVRGSK